MTRVQLSRRIWIVAISKMMWTYWHRAYPKSPKDLWIFSHKLGSPRCVVWSMRFVVYSIERYGGFHKWRVHQNGWFMIENPTKMDASPVLATVIGVIDVFQLNRLRPGLRWFACCFLSSQRQPWCHGKMSRGEHIRVSAFWLSHGAWPVGVCIDFIYLAMVY